MCGIVGYIGDKQAADILLDGLEKLEYRGYDSAGIAVLSSENKINVKKAKGRLTALRELIDKSEKPSGTVGIGHTRWATHGEPSDTNSHPHLSEDHKIAVVHNGIIENYAELKAYLLGKGMHFCSETDTEVIAQLLAYYYAKNHDLHDAVYKAIHRLEGAYAVGIICVDKPESFVAIRKDAPLIIGYGHGENYVASDVTAIVKHTKDISYLEDGEVCVVQKDKVTVYDAMGDEVKKEHATIDWDVSAAEKGGYQHFMFKEIMEQPDAIRRTISPRLKNGRIEFSELDYTKEFIDSLNRIVIVACGSSYHVGMVGKYNLERLLHKPIEVFLASEFRYQNPIIDKNSLVIVVSQSGETLDTMAALREAKKLGAHILSIVNVVGSSIAREADHVLYTWAGPEIAVATTKAYSTQLMVLNLLGIYLADLSGVISKTEYEKLISGIQKLPAQMQELLKNANRIQYYASLFFNHDSVFFIGRNLDYAQSLEGSLKLKEISYINSGAYAAGELKHGTISLIEDGTVVLALATYEALLEKTLSNIVEVQTRGASVIVLTTDNNVDRFADITENIITVPQTSVILQPSLSIIPLQLFAYYVALYKGLDIDKPRNLAKSVTVE